MLTEVAYTLYEIVSIICPLFKYCEHKQKSCFCSDGHIIVEIIDDQFFILSMYNKFYAWH